MFKEFKNFKEGLTCFFMFLALEKVWGVFITFSFGVFIAPIHDNGVKEVILGIAATHPIYYTLLLLLEGAFIEELICRVLPQFIFLAWVKFLKPAENEKNRFLLLLCIVSSFVFGYAHGDYTNVLSQSVAGAMFFIFFFKCGGRTGKILIPLMLVTLLHFTSNASSILSITLRN